MELGRAIVRQLNIDRRGEIPTRWMAHHLAELIQTAETAEGAARQEAEDRAADLVIKLWANRRALPPAADPLSGYSDAIKVLAALLPSSDPWRHFRRTGSSDALLHDMFGAMAQLVMGGLMLTREVEMRTILDAEWDALSGEEQLLVELLNRWHRFFVKLAPAQVDLESFYAVFLGDDETPAADAPTEEDQGAADPVTANRAAILSHVETFQARLGELIAQWRETMAQGGGEGTEDDA